MHDKSRGGGVKGLGLRGFPMLLVLRLDGWCYKNFGLSRFPGAAC